MLLTGSSLSLLLVLAHATNDAFTSMLAALLPTLQLRFGASETLLALFVATLSFSSSVTQPVFGAIADRVGRRTVGALGVITSSVVLSLVGVASSPWILLVLLLFGGLGSAAFHPAGTSIARSTASGKKGLAMGIFSAGGTIGLAVGPLLIGLFIMSGRLAYSPWLMVPGVLMGLLLFVLVPQQAVSAAHERPKLFDLELFRGPVGQLCVAGIFRSVSWVAFINAAPLWLVHVHGVPASSPVIFWTLATFSFAGGVGGILAGMLERRASRQALVTGTMLTALAPLFLLLVVPAGSILYFILVALAGALINGGLPLMVVSAQDLAPHAVGTASGMLMGLTWGVAGVLYLGLGALQELIGVNGAMTISFLTLIPGALVAWRVLQRNRAVLGA
jgi:FSR family fosmidomycin resistance protein-like MFS transporter